MNFHHCRIRQTLRLDVEVNTGSDDVPSKCPQKPLASTASMNRTRKIAQLSPSESSFGTVEGNVSDNEEVVAVDIIKEPNNENRGGRYK